MLGNEHVNLNKTKQTNINNKVMINRNPSQGISKRKIQCYRKQAKQRHHQQQKTHHCQEFEIKPRNSESNDRFIRVTHVPEKLLICKEGSNNLAEKLFVKEAHAAAEVSTPAVACCP